MSLLALTALTALCVAVPVRAALDAGRPACDYCRMIFSDSSFGGEIRTRSGQRKIYDAVECLAAAVLTDSVPQRDIRAISLVTRDAPHASLPIERAVFLYCPTLESPMGLSLAAFATRDRALRSCGPAAGRVLDWRGVLAHVNARWFQGLLSVERHARVPRTGHPPGR